MLKIFIIAAIIVLIAAAFAWYIYTRDVSTLTLTQDKLTISINKNSVSLNVKEVENETQEFSALQVTQTILEQEDGSMLVLEESSTDNMYQYNFSTPTSVYMILGAREINLLLQSNNLYVIQVKLHNRKVLNIIARQSDDQSLSLLYGMSNTQFLHIINALWDGDTSMENEMWHDALTINAQEDAVLAKWSTPLHAIDGLITPSDKE